MSFATLWRALRWVVLMVWISGMDDGCAANVSSVVNQVTGQVANGR